MRQSGRLDVELRVNILEGQRSDKTWFSWEVWEVNVRFVVSLIAVVQHVSEIHLIYADFRLTWGFCGLWTESTRSLKHFVNEELGRSETKYTDWRAFNNP